MVPDAPRKVSQAGCRRFDPGCPLHRFQQPRRPALDSATQQFLTPPTDGSRVPPKCLGPISGHDIRRETPMRSVPSTLGRLALSASVGILMTVANGCRSKEPPRPPEPTPAPVPTLTPVSTTSTLYPVTTGPGPCDINPSPVTNPVTLQIGPPADQVVWRATPSTS